jgi:hAT family C-terminal dimerisation region/Domain of unknown function (DUF4413)
LDSFEILHKIQAITTDNTGNMDTFFSSFEKLALEKKIPFHQEKNRVRCLAHIINLCVKAAIGGKGQENEVVSKLRKIVVQIRGSPQRREVFRANCDLVGVKQLELIRDVDTRWNSTLDMISRALKLRQAIDSTLRSDRNFATLFLEDDDWKSLTHLNSFLEPFKEVTVFMSSEKFPSVSFCAMVYNTVFDHLKAYIPDQNKKSSTDSGNVNETPDWITAAAQSAWNKLEKYYPSSDGLVYVLGTVLDPRCKLDYYKSARFKQAVITKYRRQITEEWEILYKPKQTENVVSDAQNQPLQVSLFEKHMSSFSKKEKKDELEIYLSQRVVSSDSVKNGSLGWWKMHEEEFPNLARMARDYLSASGTGVPVERFFSNGSTLLTPSRQSLSPHKICECVSLKCWLKFKDKSLNDYIADAVAEKCFLG